MLHKPKKSQGKESCLEISLKQVKIGKQYAFYLFIYLLIYFYFCGLLQGSVGYRAS